jgi:hypothetical protein
MRIMVIVKATRNSEAGVMPRQEDMADMIRFNEAMVAAGILKSADGLRPSRFGKRVTLRATGEKAVIDGPFAATTELVAGYWIWDVKSMDEALEWVKRCPHPMPGEEAQIELRPFFEPEDFGAEFTPPNSRRAWRRCIAGCRGDATLYLGGLKGTLPFTSGSALHRGGKRTPLFLHIKGSVPFRGSVP